jgi:beta-phosphoglucomutase-like phosphatase (HAD superfamily)
VFASLLPLHFCAGAERLLNHLWTSGVPLALATSSDDQHFRLKTTNHRNLFDRVFQHIVTGDQVDALT